MVLQRVVNDEKGALASYLAALRPLPRYSPILLGHTRLRGRIALGGDLRFLLRWAPLHVPTLNAVGPKCLVRCS